MSSNQRPTSMQLEEGRNLLKEQQEKFGELEQKIEDAQRALEELIAESTRVISALEDDKSKVESEIRTTKEFLSPMRRLPDDLLQHIFWVNFEEAPCCAWTLSSVCSSWRRIVLSMPRLWSKIRLVTTLNSSPDTVRLWLERSGSIIPLDIEIYLHIPVPPKKRRRAATPVPGTYSPPPHITDFLFHHPPTPTYVVPPVVPHPPVFHLGMHNNIPNLPPSTAAHGHTLMDAHWRASRPKAPSPTNSSWGHIVLFYLSEQMHRWKRFVFRFDRQFDSMSALRNITHDAPLLEEFEVSCGEPLRSDTDMYPYEWSWLPSADRDVKLPNIRSVALQYVPFKWTSPLIRGNLREIEICTLSTPGLGGHSNSQVTLDRLLTIISSNPMLEHLSLHFTIAHPAVLPLETMRLSELKSLSIGGSFVLPQLLDVLTCPSLESLTYDIDRDAPEEIISSLIARSSSPPISFLSVAYQSQMGPYYGEAQPGVPPWAFLSSLPQIKTLQIGHTSLDVLVEALSQIDADTGTWLTPQLENLALRNCHAQNEGVGKLVALVVSRNPPLPGSGVSLAQGPSTSATTNAYTTGIIPYGPGAHPMTPITPVETPTAVAPAGEVARLKSLELYDCALLGEDVVKWLKSRIDDVKFTEPFHSRGIPRSPSFYGVEL